MDQQNKQRFLHQEQSDDFSVLNYLIEHVKGLRPTSLTTGLVLDEVIEDA